jgi:transcriptional regulator with XRE-family HTH domain
MAAHQNDARPTARFAHGLTLLYAFQEQLESLRETAGLNRQAFADRLGLPRSTYCNLMRRGANPCLETIESIAEHLGVEPFVLLLPTARLQQQLANATVIRRRPKRTETWVETVKKSANSDDIQYTIPRE